MLYWTGCRLSEPLQMTTAHIDLSEEAVIIETLKQRKGNVYRKIPIPEVFKDALLLSFNLPTIHKAVNPNHYLLRPFSRGTADRYVKEAMNIADITGSKASAKGLRHGFAVHCASNQIPLPTIQKWMGHASMETTAIYLQVSGKEERELAGRIWS